MQGTRGMGQVRADCGAGCAGCGGGRASDAAFIAHLSCFRLPQAPHPTAHSARLRPLSYQLSTLIFLAAVPPGSPRLPGMLRSYTPCPDLKQTATTILTAGGITYMHDRSGQLHSVGCSEGVPAPGAVTLHLYSPPVRNNTTGRGGVDFFSCTGEAQSYACRHPLGARLWSAWPPC